LIRAAALAAALALLAPAAAAAQEPVPTPAPPAAPQPPAAGTLTLVAVEGAWQDGKRIVALQGRRLRVRGVLAPAVAGQAIELQVFRDGRRRSTRRTAVAPDGSFAIRLRARAGRLSLRARHPASAEIAEARAPRVTVGVAPAVLSPGARGPLVELVQRGLARLHYAVSRSGVFDDATARAAMAYRKVNGFPRRFDAGRRVILRILAGKGAFRVRHPHAGRHVEADISRQVLALIDHGRVFRTYHMSSGRPGLPTVIGSFRVYLKTPGFNARGMLDSNYFIRGYAIHGYVDVPAFNASHGCLRIPIPDAAFVFGWLRIGDRVIVYP
jgi:L,D-transpeptidase catalytic domain